jgi:hypothetical protein
VAEASRPHYTSKEQYKNLLDGCVAKDKQVLAFLPHDQGFQPPIIRMRDPEENQSGHRCYSRLP